MDQDSTKFVVEVHEELVDGSVVAALGSWERRLPNLVEYDLVNRAFTEVFSDFGRCVVGAEGFLVDILLEDVSENVGIDLVVVLTWYVIQVPRIAAEEGKDILKSFVRNNYIWVVDLDFMRHSAKADSISASVLALFKRLRIPKPKGSALHLLRHSHGSHMLANGVPLPVVSQRLGHSSVRTTADIYAHAIHGQDPEAVKKWEEYQEQHRETKPADWKGDVQ